MRNCHVKNTESGFSLVEVLVVVVIMGLVMTSVFSLYLSQQRTANTSDEVIDVQQNLRIAYDMMSRDIRMAGFAHSRPVSFAGGGRLAIRTPSPFNRYARMEGVYADNSGAPGDVHTDSLNDATKYFVKVPYEQAQAIRGGNIFRVISPQNSSSYVGTDVSLEVWKDPYCEGVDCYLPVEMSGTLAASEYAVGEMGDVLARVPGATYNPYDDGSNPGDVLVFELDDPDATDNQQRLTRTLYDELDGTVIGSPEILADKIVYDSTDPNAGLHFDYLYTNASSVVQMLPPLEWDEDVESDASLDLDQIVAIQVTLSGATDTTATGSAQMSGVKSREVLGRIQMKNRKLKYKPPE